VRLVVAFCAVSPHSIPGRGQMCLPGALCINGVVISSVSCRRFDGLVGHDGHDVLGFEYQSVDRCALVVFFVFATLRVAVC
jgi:hypothetical protein